MGGFPYLIFSKGDKVSAAASVGDERSPLATIAPLCIPPQGEDLTCRFGSCAPVGRAQDRPKRERRPAQDALHRRAAPPCNPSTRRGSAPLAPPVRACLALAYCKQGFQRGMQSPFEMRYIE